MGTSSNQALLVVLAIESMRDSRESKIKRMLPVSEARGSVP